MNKIYPWLLAIVFLIGLVFSVYKLTESPPFWYDEGWYFQTAANLATQGVDGIQLSPGIIYHVSAYVTVGYPLIFPLAGWFSLWGVNVASGRSLMVLFICCFLALAYFITKRLSGKWVALGAVALLATFPPLYGNGKSILGEVPGLLYLTLFLLCFNMFHSSSQRRLMWIILCGVFAGLCISTKPFFLILVPALLVGVYLDWRKGLITNKELWIGAFSLIVPIVIWIFVQFRGTESLLEILHYYVNPYDKMSLTGTILQNIQKLFVDVGTLYTMFLIGIWTTSGIIRLQKQKTITSEEIIGFIFSILTVFSFLRTGGLYRYLFPAQIVALIFFPSVLLGFRSLKLFREPLQILRNRVLYVGIISCLSILGLYQLMFSSWVAEAYDDHKTAFWQEYFTHIPASTSVFFYDTPEVVPFILHRNYYQFLLSPAGKTIGSEVLPILTSGRVDKVIVATSKYQVATSTFAHYTLDRRAYKYSILKAR